MDRRALLRLYDGLFADPMFRAFLGDSGYANYGYWRKGTASGREACDNLVDLLLANLPMQGEGSGRRAVLDVACGEGGTTRRLADRFGELAVAAVNLSPRQLRATQRRVPDARLACADAAHLPFADASFDAVLCVEAAFHFDTRADFLRDALRVLRRGGWLLLADVVGTRGAGRVAVENRIATVADYTRLLAGLGFADVRVDDVTEATWRTFRRRYARFALRHPGVLLRMLARLPHLLWRAAVTERAIGAYVTVAARRP